MSDFPTLDLLERCGLGTAFKILMLGARSASDFQRLCERVIPENCRPPRSMVIDLMRERDRWLGAGKDTAESSRGSRIKSRPSDAELRSLFLEASIVLGNAGRKPGSLTSYFCALLRQHASGTDAMLLFGETEYHFVVTRSHGGNTELLTGILATSNARFEIRIRRRLVTVDPPDGMTLPSGHYMTKRETKLVVVTHVDRNELTFAKCEQLLALPHWQHQYSFNDYEVLSFMPTVTEEDVASWFDNGGQQELSIAGLERLRLFLVARGIDIPRLTPGS